MVFERPQRPGKPTARPNPTQRPNRQNRSNNGGNDPRRPGNNGRGGGGNRGNGNGDDNRPPQPSPWLRPEDEPEPDNSASFVEYLRWMRSPDHPQKDGTKTQMMQMAEDAANYDPRLRQLTNRTKLIAGQDNYFQVKCSWRVRVGGHRGPENILLPAFDALGIPYIPSSTLRGVARTQAIREIAKQQNIRWEEAEKQIAPWFGSLEATKKSDRSGKIIFLDAYPLPGQMGLEMDMANNIWKWENDELRYNPNPNTFFSLREPIFLIGLKLASHCNDSQILQRVKQWLTAGLKAGIGSQVNTGYGELMPAGSGRSSDEFLRVEFSIEGQLIHGRQMFTEWNWNERRNDWQMRGQADAEVRPVAFKSMLRYWFRAFSLGVLDVNTVQEWEAKLFGGINPKRFGCIRVDIRDGKVTQREPRPNFRGKDDDCGEQIGTLILSDSASSEVSSTQKKQIHKLFESLTWMMFHLGGIGQGARRPCYSRKTRDRAPWYRGSTFYIDSDDELWEIPDSLQGFQQKFQHKLKQFYQSLSELTQNKINPRKPQNLGRVRRDQWTEAVDGNCRIIVVKGESKLTEKLYAIDFLHEYFHQLEDKRKFRDAKSLCGGIKNDRIRVGDNEIERKVTPSPVWIADLGDYQVVTVFGATQNPRHEYLNRLRSHTDRSSYWQIWPLQSSSE